MRVVESRDLLMREVQAVQTGFGQSAKLCWDSHRRDIWWEVPLRVEGSRMTVRVFYPPQWPTDPPEVVVMDDLPAGLPHLSADGRIDLGIVPGAAGRLRWDPQKDTAASCLWLAERWLLAWVIWRGTGRWPEFNQWRPHVPSG